MSAMITAAVVGVVAAVGEHEGQKRSAEAAGKAAQAREAELKTAVGMGKKGLEAAQDSSQAAIRAANSPSEIAALTKAMKVQTSALDKQSQLFDSLDPAVLEASQQALGLMRGEEAKSLGPLKNQIATQRQQLVDRLREQLGPGAETSTAGMQALNQFDQQSSMQLGQAQEQSMGNLFNMASTGARNRSSLNQGTQALGNIGGLFGQSAGRRSGAAVSAAGVERQGFADLMNAQAGLAAGAGSIHVDEQLKGQAVSQLSSNLGQVGSSYLGGV